MLWILFLIILALFFDYLNGFHDAANSVATVVSTRVLSPKVAVAWAAFFNFVAFLIFHTGVAKTIGAGIVDIHIVDSNLVFGALMGACVWNILTWWWGLPSSSSHALIGGLIGAGFVKGGVDALMAGGIFKTVLFIFLSPLLGFLLSVIIGIIVFNVCRPFNPYKVDHWFRKGQLLSAAAYSLGHGGNDAQKTMGIISMLLLGGLAGNEVAPIRDFLLTHEEMHAVTQGAFIVPRGHCLGYAFRRVENCKNHGPENYPPAPGGRLLRRIGLGHFALYRLYFRGAGQHDTHHYGRHCGCGLAAPLVLRALGRGQPHCVGVVYHHSRGGLDFRRQLLAKNLLI